MGLSVREHEGCPGRGKSDESYGQADRDWMMPSLPLAEARIPGFMLDDMKPSEDQEGQAGYKMRHGPCPKSGERGGMTGRVKSEPGQDREDRGW